MKWSLELKLTCSPSLWNIIYKTCFKSINENVYKWFQFKITRKIIATKNYLKTIKVKNCELCGLCRECKETSLHLFSECNKVNDLWQNVQNWINSKIKIQIILDDTMKILCYHIQDEIFWPLNFILLITRYYIFTCIKQNSTLNIYYLQKLIKTKFEEQEMLSKVNNCYENFHSM